MPDAELPEWAVQWLPGTCGCGARLCQPICWDFHVACSASGTSVEKCPGNTNG